MLRESQGNYTTLHVKYCCSKVSTIRELLQFLPLPELCAAIILQEPPQVPFWVESRKPQSVKVTQIQKDGVLLEY